MNKVALIIIFNHRYDRNLPLLREMYKNRFANIRFLMPFYDGGEDDVIPVYESSYHFQGFFIQAYQELMKLECDAFFFISDDQIINPMINEKNVLDWLQMNEKDIYIDSYADLNSEGMFEWFPVSGVAKAFASRGIEYKSQLPSYSEAVKLYENFCGKKFEADYSDAFWGEAFEFCDELVDSFIEQNGESKKIPYPLLFGYADYFCVRKEKYYQLARVCGIFAAMNLFVEIAIPTAVMLTFDRTRVITRQEIGKYSARTRADDFGEKYNNSLSKLFQNWDDNLLFIHPIKLSRWSEKEDNEKRAINQLHSKLIKLPLGECKKIGIYGTGENTENMLACYQDLVGEIKAEIFFIDSYSKSGSKKYMERAVYNVNDLESVQLDDIIVSSIVFEEEMVKKIYDIWGESKYKIHRLYNGNTLINFVNHTGVIKNSNTLPQLKVKFIGMFDNFSGRTSLIYRLLSKYYSLEISEQPQLLVYSHAPFNEINDDKFHKYTNLQATWLDEYCEREHEKYHNCLKLLWKRGIKENGVDDFDYDTVNSSFDYVVGYPYLNNDKYFYFNTDIAKQCYDKREKLDEEIPIQFCSYVYMNENWGEGARLRKEFYKRLSKYKKVDCLWNYEGQNKYKFTIVFENHSKPGYASKIIWKAILSGSIPIYWGAPDICDRIGLNPNTFINCTKYGEDIDSMIAEIIRIDENDELYRDMRRQAPFKEKYSTEKLEKFLCNVAEEAKRGKNG